MEDPNSNETAASWPFSIGNCHALNSGAPALETQEFPLFTDASIIGEARVGPYAFLNAAAGPTAGTVRPAVVLRYAFYKEFEYPDLKRTDQKQYHGGTVQDELAALASLAIGVRLRASNATRIFRPGGDPFGTPDHFGVFFVPTVNVEYSPVLPSAFGKHGLDALDVLWSFISLDPAKAAAVMRAARLYQDALWLVESVPEFAWLLLVSAVETAAKNWESGVQVKQEDSDQVKLTRLEQSRPDLYRILAGSTDDAVLPLVASYFAKEPSVGKTFVNFLIAKLPPPPIERAPEGAQFSWTEENLTDAFRVIYRYRSKALHIGRPFPRPMSGPAFKQQGWQGFAEVMTALAQGERGGVWIKKDIPMNLHLFEYIARNVLLNWWSA